jgi:hypothetical protein
VRIFAKIKKKLNKLTEWSAKCPVKNVGAGLFKVASSEYEDGYYVDLKANTCECKRWQLTGIPYQHAIFDGIRMIENNNKIL